MTSPLDLDRLEEAAREMNVYMLPFTPDVLLALISAARGLRGGDTRPPKMLVDADWLRRKVETDPDLDTEAAAPPPPEPSEEVVEPAAKAAYETYCAMSMGLMFAEWDKEPEESKNIARAQVRAVLRVLKSEGKEV